MQNQKAEACKLAVDAAIERCRAEGVPTSCENVSAAMDGISPRMAQRNRHFYLVGWCMTPLLIFAAIHPHGLIDTTLALTFCGVFAYLMFWRARQLW